MGNVFFDCHVDRLIDRYTHTHTHTHTHAHRHR